MVDVDAMSEPADADSRRKSPDEGEIALCPGCLDTNPPQAPFCHKCGMPIGMIATLDPIQQIYSTGWVYRRAISGGRWPLAFWGMWVIFGPSILVPLLFVCGAVWDERFSPAGVSRVLFSLGVAQWLFFVFIYVAILYRVTKGYARHLLAKPGHCELCGYDLSLLRQPRCPECGTAFDPAGLPGEPRRDVTPDWVPPDVSGISDADFPICCDGCGHRLAAMVESGSCVRCQSEFDRRERLVETYGPEVFGPSPVVRSGRIPRGLSPVRALVMTFVFIASFPVLAWISQNGGPPEMQLIAGMFLFIATLIEWGRLGRGAMEEGRDEH